MKLIKVLLNKSNNSSKLVIRYHKVRYQISINIYNLLNNNNNKLILSQALRMIVRMLVLDINFNNKLILQISIFKLKLKIKIKLIIMKINHFPWLINNNNYLNNNNKNMMK